MLEVVISKPIKNHFFLNWENSGFEGKDELPAGEDVARTGPATLSLQYAVP